MSGRDTGRPDVAASVPAGQEIERLPGAQEALDLLDHAIAVGGGQLRQGQRVMAAHVARALTVGEHLLVQAGTGTGKSLAYLVPALKKAQKSDKPIIVATATLALQTQIVKRDIPQLLEALGPRAESEVEVATLKGRNNYVCLHKLEGGYPADEQETLFAVEPSGLTGKLGQEVMRLRAWAEETDSGDRDELLPGVSDRAWRQVSVSATECLGRSCPLVESCFSELARQKASQADLVVTNHTLLAIHAFEGRAVLPEHEVVIIDEAHELADRVTAAVTGSLSPAMLASAVLVLAKNTQVESAPLEQASQALEAALTGLEAQLLPQGLGGQLATALAAVRDASRAALSDMKSESQDPDAARQQARAKVTEILELSERLLAADQDHDVIWLSRPSSWEEGKGYRQADETEAATLELAPLSVGGRLRQGLFEGRTVILTSATLTIGHSFRGSAEVLGLSENRAPSWRGIDVGSPFNYPRQGVLYVAGDLPKPGQSISEQQLERMAQLVKASAGGALGLFSSRGAAQTAAAYLRKHTDCKVLLQGESSIGALVKEFTEDKNSCLLGSMTLWQGVDVPGQSCRLVVVDRIPFPRPNDPLIAARTRAVSRAGGNGFMAVSAYHAAIRLAQGAGRLIRRVEDRGVVALLDSRLASQPYGAYIVSALPPFWRTQDQQTVLAALSRLADEEKTES